MSGGLDNDLPGGRGKGVVGLPCSRFAATLRPTAGAALGIGVRSGAHQGSVFSGSLSVPNKKFYQFLLTVSNM